MEHIKLVGITKHLSTHSFRCGLVTSLKREGYNYEEISVITRHKDKRTLIEHYDKEHKKRAFEIVIRKVSN